MHIYVFVNFIILVLVHFERFWRRLRADPISVVKEPDRVLLDSSLPAVVLNQILELKTDFEILITSVY